MKPEHYVLILQALALLALGYLAFFKSYFQEKGKNLATREDVEEITGKVEKIKKDIHLVTESKLSLRKEQHNALVDYYTSFRVWLQSLVDADLTGASEDDETAFQEIKLQLKEAVSDFRNAQGRVELFVDTGEIANLENGCVTGALEIEHQIRIAIIELKQIFVEKRFVKKMEDQEAKLIEYRARLTKEREIHSRLFAQRDEKYRAVYAKSWELRAWVFSKITALIEE